jgi:hypothetical protein
MSAKFTVKIESFTACQRHTLVGFVDVIIPELRMRLVDLIVHQHGDARWAAMPARPLIDGDGIAERDGRGKIVYSPIMGFLDAKTREAFSARVIEALLIFDPTVFDDVQPEERSA